MTEMNYKHSSKILVVDDDHDILEILEYNLNKQGYQVRIADRGNSALEILSEYKPDLILLDIMMPGMDGVEVCKKIRLMPEHHDTLIAFLTARGEDFTQIAALDSGGDDFISKPIKPNVLISRIKALLRRKESVNLEEGKSILNIDGVEIDIEKFTVKKNGEQIELAKKEFQILLLLMSKPGKVFTRDEIFRKVWGNDVIVGNRTIDVHIRKIREKIGDEIFKTVKGVGYKFDA